MRALILFDIDGTLIRTRGAGREALDEAFYTVYGWERATEGVSIGGSTDGAICAGVAGKFGSFDAETVKHAYVAALTRRLGDAARVEVLPGVRQLIAALHDHAHIALLTGNWERGAALKLGAAGLWHCFAWGAFAEDGVDRNVLVPVACRRARARGLSFDRVIVIGDTTADIACARAGGADVIVTETGFSTPIELEGSKPDLQVATLADSRVLPFLLG